MPAAALNPAIPLRDLNHTAWTEKEGAPPDIFTMAQTPDGWLWLGARDGLYRFDGIRFERLPTRKESIFHLHATEQGELYIAYAGGGLSVLRADGTMSDFTEPALDAINSISALARDAQGALWLVSWNGLFQYRQGQVRHIAGGREWNGKLRSLLRDQYGRLWTANDAGTFLIDPQNGLLQPAGPGGKLTQSPDGQLWVATMHGLQRLAMPAVASPLPRRAYANQASSNWAGQFDRDGNLWSTQCPLGVCRIRKEDMRPDLAIFPAQDATDRLDQHWQLSALSADETLEDREGNLWVMTRAGIDRFRENKLIAANIPAPSGVFSMVADRAGQLWVADLNDGGLWKVTPGQAPQRDPRRHVQMVATDRSGALLLAGKRQIERIDNGVSSVIPLPLVAGQPADLRMMGMLDDGKVLWVATTQTGLMALVDGHWVPRSQFNLPANIMSVAAGGSGQLWLGHNNGKLSFYDNGKLSEYDISAAGAETGLFPGAQMVVAGERGIAVQRGQRFELLGPPNVAPLRKVSGMLVTPDGDRWLNGSQGVVRIRRDDWEAAVRAPQQPLKFELLDAQDGYAGRASLDLRLPTVVGTGNGRIWFLGSGGVVRLETALLRTNDVKPAIQIVRLNTDAASYAAAAGLQLPPDSRSFNIQYTAPGLRKPEGMRFQYRLEGVDQHWIDAGARRVAYYTNVGPGQYTFHVRALNEDGVASANTAAMRIEVAPTVLQSWWCRLLCVSALAGGAYALYKYRIRQAMAQLARQLQARTDERERIARTLHDTFLQSLYALMLQVHGVLVKLPAESEPRRKLENILDETNRVMDEGRGQVHQLRTSYDVEQLLKQGGESMAAIHPDTAFVQKVAGQRRVLSTAVQEDICGIGQEAIYNAYRHAGGSQVTLELRYHRSGLTLRVSDNGKGYDAAAVQPGHWGLIGMRERAQRTGGQLDIQSGTAGTIVTLIVPARLAFEAG